MIQHSTWQLLSRRPILDPSDNKLYHTSPLGNLDFMEARHKFVRHRFPIRKRVFLFKRRKNNKASLRKQLAYFLRPSALLSKILITSPLRPSPSSKDIGKVGFTTFSDVRQSKFSYREGRGAHSFRRTDRNLGPRDAMQPPRQRACYVFVGNSRLRGGGGGGGGGPVYYEHVGGLSARHVTR